MPDREQCASCNDYSCRTPSGIARPCVLKAAGAKDLAMKASSSQEQKQLLMLAEQAEKEEQNRMELPPRGLTKK